MISSLFVVEHVDGELWDERGEGGYTVWTSRHEAQEILDSAEDQEQESMSVVEFRRVGRSTLDAETLVPLLRKAAAALEAKT